MNTQKEIGEYLKQLRKHSGMTQAELATKMGVAAPTLAQFEGGRKNMTLATLNKIAESLGYDLSVSFVLKTKNTVK